MVFAFFKLGDSVETIIKFGLDLFLPTKLVCFHPKDFPWITPELKLLIKDRQSALATGNMELFRELRNKVNRTRKVCRKCFYNSSIDTIKKSDPRQWWNEIKRLCGLRKTSAVLQVNLPGGQAVSSCEDKLHLANIINTAFIKPTVHFEPIDAQSKLSVGDDVIPFQVHPDAVYNKLTKIKSHKAGGPDGIPNWIWNKFPSILATPVCMVCIVA